MLAASAALLLASNADCSPRAFQVWQMGDKLQQGTVTDIVQTQDGYLWLGTYHGLVRHDGVRFSVFRGSNTPGLRNSLVTSLFEDPGGQLWIGHETGELTRYSHGRFFEVDLGATWPGGAILDMATDEKEDLWLLSDLGSMFRVRDHTALPVPGGATASRKPALSRGRSGKLWLASNGAIYTIEQGQLAPVRFRGASTNSFFDRVLSASDGGLWVVSDDRVRKWREGRWVEELGPIPAGPGAVSTLMETRWGGVAVGTVKDGLYLLAPKSAPQHFNRANGLSHDWVRSLCEDEEGNIWVGTGGGLDALRARKVTMFDPPDGWQGCGVRSFVVEPDGAAWVGTEGAGLYHYDGVGWERFCETNGLTNPYVWAVLETRNRGLLVGTWGGGVLVKVGTRFEAPGDLAKITAPVVCLYEASEEELWVGTTAGLYRFEGNRLTWSAGPTNLALPDVRTITQTPDGAVWFGMSGGGLGRFKDNSLRQYRKADGLTSDFVLSLHAGADGALWYGTADSGLGRLKGGRFAAITSKQGLLDDSISHVVDDGAGHFWLGSQQGILVADKANLERCADGSEASIYCLSYGQAEGLASLICSGGFQPGACRSEDGRVWFPTSKGVAIVDPANESTNSVAPPVVIEEVTADRQPLELEALGEGNARGQPLQIPAGRQRVQFHYTALSFTAPERVRFKYRLDGLETDWVDAGTERVHEYSYLRPGSYTFHVIACNNDGVWNNQGATLAIVVLPHFWQTWWFFSGVLGLGAIAVALGVLAVARRRLRRKLELLERQRAIERERARIARDIHDDLGASLTRITMLSQSVRGELNGEPEAAAEVDQIYSTARELTRAMDEIVWAVNPKHDTLDSLVTYLGRFAQNFLSAAGLRCRLDVPLHLPTWSLTAEVRHNVFLAFKEALHNVIKHARASEVRLSLELQPDRFVLVVADNGHGFDPVALERGPGPTDAARVASGNGRANMKRRLEEIGGSCEWVSAPEEGTRVRLAVPGVYRD